MFFTRVDSVGCVLVAAVVLATAYPYAAFGEKEGATKKVQTRTVTASMEHAVGEGVGIHAVPKSGTFTIKKGQVAYDFRYSFSDHKQNVTIKHKGPGNIYSVSKQKHVAEATPNPDFTLGEGKYKFFVGGLPGASGSLTFKIKSTSEGEDSGEDDSIDEKEFAKKADRIIEITTWVVNAEDTKTQETLYVQGNKVTGIVDQEYEGIKHEYVTSEKSRCKGTFTGTIDGNVIKGTWKLKILPHKVVVHGRNGKDIGREDWSSMVINTVTTLKKGGTLTETQKITGTSNTQWDTNAPGPLAGKLQSSGFTTSVPGEDIKKPVQGTWKDKK